MTEAYVVNRNLRTEKLINTHGFLELKGILNLLLSSGHFLRLSLVTKLLTTESKSTSIYFSIFSFNEQARSLGAAI